MRKYSHGKFEQRTSSSSEISEIESSDYENDLEKLEELWTAHHTSKRDRGSHKSAGKSQKSPLKDLSPMEDDGMYAVSGTSKELRELRKYKEISDLQIEALKTENSHLASRFSKQDEIIRMQEKQLTELRKMATHFSYDKEEVFQRAGETASHLQQRLDESEREIKKLRLDLRNSEEKLSRSMISDNLKTDQLDKRFGDLRHQNHEIKKMQDEIDDWKKKYDDVQVNKNSDTLLAIENEHLRSDVKRLMRMLHSTSEFKDFASFADDGSGNLRFLRNLHKGSEESGKGKKVTFKPRETDMWVPADASKLAHEFLLNYKGELTPTLIDKLLFELNKVWNQKHVARSRPQTGQHSTRESMRKSTGGISAPKNYNDHIAQQTIKRLQGDLKTAMTDKYKPSFAKNPVHKDSQHVNEALKMVSSYNVAKKQMVKENQVLRDEFKKMVMSSGGKSPAGASASTTKKGMATQALEEMRIAVASAVTGGNDFDTFGNPVSAAHTVSLNVARRSVGRK